MALQSNSNWLTALNSAASAATGTLLSYWTGQNNPANPQSVPAETARKGEAQAKGETAKPAWYTQPAVLLSALALLVVAVPLLKRGR